MLKESYQMLRQTAFDKIGGKCQECGTIEKLHLHHKFYADDSIRPKRNECGNDTVKRTKEAILHPERFLLWCVSCHNSKQPRVKKIIVDKIEKSTGGEQR